MRIKVVKTYTDLTFNKRVFAGMEIEVSADKAERLVRVGVAEYLTPPTTKGKRTKKAVVTDGEA